METPHVAYLSLGSNLGNRKQNLDRAIELLNEKLIVEIISGFYDTEPVTEDIQPRYLNFTCRVKTDLAPEQLLSAVKAIERQMGTHRHNRPRTIDIDILLYDNLVLNTTSLKIPHPRMTERAFVLVPLAEIAPEARYPITDEPISTLLNKLKDKHEVRRWRPEQESNNV